jgi:hypothetical protein
VTVKHQRVLDSIGGDERMKWSVSTDKVRNVRANKGVWEYRDTVGGEGRKEKLVGRRCEIFECLHAALSAG